MYLTLLSLTPRLLENAAMLRITMQSVKVLSKDTQVVKALIYHSQRKIGFLVIKIMNYRLKSNHFSSYGTIFNKK